MNGGLCRKVPCTSSPPASCVLDVFSLSACVARCLTPLSSVWSPSASDRPVAMGGGNGAKSKTKRERNATKTAKTGKTSQLGANLKAMSIICTVCKQVRSFVLSCTLCVWLRRQGLAVTPVSVLALFALTCGCAQSLVTLCL